MTFPKEGLYKPTKKSDMPTSFTLNILFALLVGITDSVTASLSIHLMVKAQGVTPSPLSSPKQKQKKQRKKFNFKNKQIYFTRYSI